MSSILANIPKWVKEAPNAATEYRQAAHCVLNAIAGNKKLRELLCMKGGLLMALHYESPRYTTDIDFSTPLDYSPETEKEVIDLLSEGLAQIPEELGYDIDCKIQKCSVKPSRTSTYVNLQMNIGYAVKGTHQHKQLMGGNASSVVSIDYSFKESIPEYELVELEDDGSLYVYALSTLVAEKFRSLLQQPIRNRYRRQDVYDLNYLLTHRPELFSMQYMQDVFSDLKVKCRDRQITPTIDSFDNPEIKRRAETDYKTLEIELEDGDLPSFDEIFDRVCEYYKALPWPRD